MSTTSRPDSGESGAVRLPSLDAYRPRARWVVFVADEGVVGEVGAFRWLWMARVRAHRYRRYWPGSPVIDIRWVP